MSAHATPAGKAVLALLVAAVVIGGLWYSVTHGYIKVQGVGVASVPKTVIPFLPFDYLVLNKSE